MSVHEVTYYQVQCDCCGQICDEYGDFSALSLPGYARDGSAETHETHPKEVTHA